MRMKATPVRSKTDKKTNADVDRGGILEVNVRMVGRRRHKTAEIETENASQRTVTHKLHHRSKRGKRERKGAALSVRRRSREEKERNGRTDPH